MEPHGNDHGVGCPAMHIAYEHAERHVEFQVFHIQIGVLTHRSIVEHQNNTGEGKHEKEEKRNPPHTPCEADAHPMTREFGWMEMEPDIAQDHQQAITWGVVVV